MALSFLEVQIVVIAAESGAVLVVVVLDLEIVGRGAGEALLDTAKLVKEGGGADSGVGALALITGFFSAFIVGCGACKWMIALVKRGKLIWFAVYCIAMGIICLLWQ